MGYWIEIDLGEVDSGVRLGKLIRFCLEKDMMTINDVELCLASFLEIEAYEMCAVLHDIINENKNVKI